MTVLAWMSEDSCIRMEDVVRWIKALPAVLLVVVAGLGTAEIVLKRFKPLALRERFFDRYRFMVLP